MEVDRFGRLAMQTAFRFGERAERCQRAPMYAIGQLRIGHDLSNNGSRSRRRRCFGVHMNFRAGNT